MTDLWTEWRKAPPTETGWYFFKPRTNSGEWSWLACFVEFVSGKPTYWIGGSPSHAPKGGWWLPIKTP